MFTGFTFLFLLDPLFMAPDPTKEILVLIKDLGSDSHKTRVKASACLKALDYKAIKAVRNACRDSKNAEVRRRARIIIECFYNVWDKDTPPIHGLYDAKSWKLKSGRQFDLPDPMIYYKKAGGDPGDDDQNTNADNYQTIKATETFVHTLRNIGFTAKECYEVLTKMQENTKENYMGGEGWRRFREMQSLEVDIPEG
jgi:hypothetical protein